MKKAKISTHKEPPKPQPVVPYQDPPEKYINLAAALGPDYWVGDLGQVPVVYRNYGNGYDVAITVRNQCGGDFSVLAHIWHGVAIVESFGESAGLLDVEKIKRWLDRMHEKYGGKRE